MSVGVPGVHGQHAPKPAVVGHRIVNGSYSQTANCTDANIETRVCST